MSDIQKIITYFFHHSFSKDMIDRVHRRMMAKKNEKEQDEACFSLWEEIGFPEDERRSEEAFNARSQTCAIAFLQMGAYSRFVDSPVSTARFIYLYV